MFSPLSVSGRVVVVMTLIDFDSLPFQVDERSRYVTLASCKQNEADERLLQHLKSNIKALDIKLTDKQIQDIESGSSHPALPQPLELTTP